MREMIMIKRSFVVAFLLSFILLGNFLSPAFGADQSAAGPPRNLFAPASRTKSQKLSSISKIALGEVDKRFNDDKTKYNGYNGNMWCASFISWVYNQAGYKMPFIEVSRDIISWFKKNGHYAFNDPSEARSGDVVVWKRGRNGHTGIVVSNDGKYITTVEGNGPRDEVRAKVYSYTEAKNNLSGLYGFGRW